jgi:PAS domain S-box-containing protein
LSKAEEELHHSAKLYSTVVEQVAENIFLVDVKTKRILEANTSFRTSLGYTTDELRQLTLYDFVAHDKESVDRDIQHVLEKGHSFLGERKYRCKDGLLVDVAVNVSIISNKGREAMCVVAHDVTDRKQIEQDLRQSLSIMLALREAGQILGSTLESEEIVSRLLEIMRRVSSLTAAVISTPDEDGHLRIWRSVGLDGLWRRARFSPEAEAARRAVLENKEFELFELQSPYPEIGSLVGLCLPLNTRQGVIGVLEAYGPQLLAEGDTVHLISSLANQAASALENAQLYGELAKRERRLQELVGKLLGAQEEERRSVAYEVHDGLAQVAYSAYQHLQAYSKLYPPAAQEAKEKLDRGVSLIQQTVKEARSIIADLRPTVLDDFGLAAAVSQEIERLREEGYQVDYREELGEERLPATAEITLFRVAQETLTNVRKHAHTRQVSVELWRRKEEAYLEIKDFGQGFDSSTAGAGGEPGERVGLAGMRERVGMLDGELQIHSKLGVGTSIRAKIPLALTAEET